MSLEDDIRDMVDRSYASVGLDVDSQVQSHMERYEEREREMQRDIERASETREWFYNGDSNRTGYNQLVSRMKAANSSKDLDECSKLFTIWAESLEHYVKIGHIHQSCIDDCKQRSKECKEKSVQIHQTNAINAILSRYNKAKTDVENVQRSDDYDRLAKEFSSIAEDLKSSPHYSSYQSTIEECKHYAEQCIEKRDQLKRDETLDRFNKAKADVENAQKSDAYDRLAAEFSNIAEILKSLPRYIQYKPIIDEAQNYYIQCLEKKDQLKKDEALSILKILKAEVSNMKTVEEYNELAVELVRVILDFKSLPISSNVQSEIEECEELRKECIKKSEDINNQIKKVEIFSRYYKAKANLQDAQTYNNYVELTREFAEIERDFQSLPNSFNVQSEITECVNYCKQCEEKRYEVRKDNILARFNILEKDFQDSSTIEEYTAREEEFAEIKKDFESLSSSFDVQSKIDECQNYCKQCEEKRYEVIKGDIISRFNTAKNKLQNCSSIAEYTFLAEDFVKIRRDFESILNQLNVQTEIMECENYTKQCEEKRNQFIKLEKEEYEYNEQRAFTDPNFLFELLGLDISSTKMQSYMKKLGYADKRSGEDFNNFVYASDGITLQFEKKSNTLKRIILFSDFHRIKRNRKFSQYNYPLPYDLNFNDNMKTIKSKLGGEPDIVRGMGISLPEYDNCKEYIWQRLKHERKIITIEYDGVDFLFFSGKIMNIEISYFL